ncbi:hypothetical protein OPQ81_009088 [Rhizoctonia solani]|nr:hypothetical protein OPQ81_009088 [Rhizoctonia solani]
MGKKRRPKPHEQDFFNFTRDNDLHLLNEFTTPTRIHPNCPASNSIIDLTFLNRRAADAWPNFNFEVESQDSEHSVGSDHMAVTWTLTPFTTPDQNESDDPDTGNKSSYVIDPALHEDWVSGFSHALEQEDLPSDPIMAEDADRGHGSDSLLDHEVVRWETPRPHAPPSNPPPTVVSPRTQFEKPENFAHQFFRDSSSPNISLEPLGVPNHPKRPFQPITTEEIIASLKQTSNRSAPGAFGANYCLLKWAFYSHSDIFTRLFNCCLWTGYHPTCLGNTIISPIPKPRRTDMSHPKNYRPIALLETLSKLLEKVITKRLIHEAGAHNLIPHSQFGGRDMTSCTDAGLCMTHDIRTCWAQKKEVTLLTLDVSGYFNNVDHARLIYTLDRLGYSDQICNWLRSYLTSRTAQFRVDGTLCPQLQLPSVGVPQGSPLSPVLSSLYSIPLLAASSDPQAHSFAYVDDFTILAYSRSHQENITIIQDIITRINNNARKLGLEFELPKSELIHFIRPYSKCNSNPTLTISDSGTDVVIHPLDVIRWLGFYLDRKLNFKEHVKNMATRALGTIAGLRMLANTVRGLSIRHARYSVQVVACYRS